jgi:hypothetical protein
MNSDASSRNNASALLKLVMAGLGGGGELDVVEAGHKVVTGS